MYTYLYLFINITSCVYLKYQVQTRFVGVFFISLGVKKIKQEKL